MVVTVLMVVRAGASLAVEVKTPTKVGSRAHSMTVSEAATAVRKALKEALRQLAGGPGMLVVGGFNIDAGTFTALGDAAGEIVKRDGSESNLMAIVVANFTVAVGDTDLGLGPSEIGFGQKSRMRSNRFYSGPIEFVGDWNGEWEFVSRHASQSTSRGDCSRDSARQAEVPDRDDFHTRLRASRFLISVAESLVLNYGFVDGNKRTAMYAMAAWLGREGYVLEAARGELRDLALSIASRELNAEQVAAWLAQRSNQV